MKTYHLPNTDLQVSRLAYGCMLIGGTWDKTPLTDTNRATARAVLARALQEGINLFDHADIYTRGKSETVFADAIKELGVRRDSIILQSKCGIRFRDDPNPGDPQRFDFSYEHILKAVEGSLRRLQTDYLDILLLHRPDALVEPEQVARAFDELAQAGKVRYFGVSNQNPGQMSLLRKYVRQPLVVNQLELNLLHSDMIDNGIFVNQNNRPYSAADNLLDYCRLHDITIQAWAPVAGGRLSNPSADASDAVKRTATAVGKMAQDKGVTSEAILLAWLLRHPAHIQPILGTTNPERVSASAKADNIELTREEWYSLLQASRGRPVP